MKPERRISLQALPFFPALRFCYQLVRNFQSRRSALLMLRRPAGLFQPYGTTQEDRYPRIFSQLHGLITDGPDRSLLSFGCSTGEEVFTLARYFQQAAIKGIDIDPARIRLAQRRGSKLDLGQRVSFACAATTTTEATACYDAVLAMAVFRHGALKKSSQTSRPWLHFDDFERCVADLARVIKPGGYLALRYANFRFTDTAVSADFDLVLAVPPDPSIPIYGPDDNLRPGVGDDGLYRKKPTAT